MPPMCFLPHSTANIISGAAVLAHSLRDADTKKKLAALVTLDTLAADTVGELKVRDPAPPFLTLLFTSTRNFTTT